jgi:cell division protein FtsQ
MSSIALLNGLYNRRRTEPAPKIRRLFLILIAILAIILIAEVLFHFVISPRLRLTKVEIIAGSELSLSDAAIIKLAGLNGDETFFGLDSEGIARRIASYAPVKSVQLEKVFPNTLRISITQREPLALCLATVDDRSVPIIVDEEGVVFQIGESVEEYDLPVLSGFTFASIELGHRINRRLMSFFNDLQQLKNSSPKVFSLISELHFVKKDRAGFEVLLYPKDYRVPVRLASTINADIMHRILLVLDVFAKQEMFEAIDEIDFRTATPLVRFKEE